MQTPILIIGASFSGLATAACLRRRKLAFEVIEQEDSVAAPWRHHYHRLHLHTNKRLSGLPYRAWGAGVPRYPSRLEVIAYLEEYARSFDIQPHFHRKALSVRRSGAGWITETGAENIESRYVVMATGVFGRPRTAELAGRFSGRLVHSSDYSTGAEYAGQRVLVVGFGNSACEIAIDLVEQGAQVSMAVRSAVNVIPREILGVPVLELALCLQYLPPQLADRVSAPLVRAAIGDLRSLGLSRKPFGPLEQIAREGKTPVLDIGIVRMIRDGEVRVFDGVDRLEGSLVHFADGRSSTFDAVILGVGYESDSARIAKVEERRFEDLRLSAGRQRFFGTDGLYFCGFWISPTGQIREIARDARRIAADIARREAGKQ